MNLNKGEAIQLAGVILLTIALVAEYILRANIWYIVLTGGAFVFALGTKIKHGGA